LAAWAVGDIELADLIAQALRSGPSRAGPSRQAPPFALNAVAPSNQVGEPVLRPATLWPLAIGHLVY
jgi:hypothetical protein